MPLHEGTPAAHQRLDAQHKDALKAKAKHEKTVESHSVQSGYAKKILRKHGHYYKFLNLRLTDWVDNPTKRVDNKQTAYCLSQDPRTDIISLFVKTQLPDPEDSTQYQSIEEVVAYLNIDVLFSEPNLLLNVQAPYISKGVALPNNEGPDSNTPRIPLSTDSDAFINTADTLSFIDYRLSAVNIQA